ncbi:uncharacterized protein LOC114540574 isoform X2 [Dendronephthya gigantea]|uniref:uncharacterized protein LOC114540574 isoform X2 n=1 Tax=Dendronephthya gigantea TaxID=151771 RepID=UPI00106D8769|nr:uncharacterized protein LOC114540574 isoform X2 [Dendronephthya gigantea]
MKSLCQIHGLYGYPASTNSDYSPDDEVIAIKPEAVKEIFNSLTKNDKTLGDYHTDAKEDKFWQFESFTDLVREPAHILLEMMQDLFDGHEDACEATLELLEDLTDGNYLKPVIWMENKEFPGNCGFSLGVRPFLRPLYVHTRLREVRKHRKNDLKLAEVNGYQCVDRKDFKRNPNLAKKKSKYRKSGNGKPRRKMRPCKSCEIFFDSPPTLSRRSVALERNLGVFGNCAEYDVIKTRKLDELLGSTANTSWKDFESACNEHLRAFNDLTRKTGENQDPYPVLKEYFESTRKPKNAKVLRYELNSESQNYKLQAKDWRPEESDN